MNLLRVGLFAEYLDRGFLEFIEPIIPSVSIYYSVSKNQASLNNSFKTKHGNVYNYIALNKIRHSRNAW